MVSTVHNPLFFRVFTIDERAVRTARELDASENRRSKRVGGGGGGERKEYFSFVRFPPLPPARSHSALASSLRLRFCVEKSRGCGQSNHGVLTPAHNSFINNIRLY